MFNFIQQRRSAFLIGLVIVTLLLLASTFIFISQAPDEERSSGVPTKKLMRYSFTLANQTGEVAENVVFRVFAPVESTPFQKVESIESSQPFERRKDSVGNLELEFQIDSLPPHGQKVITVSAEMSMWDAPRTDFISPELAQLGAIPLAAETNKHVQRALNEIESSTSKDSPVAWLKTANSWVYQAFEDVGYVSRDRGALFALSERKGDCTEFMHALVALSRAQQIPSLAVAGFRIDGGNAILKAMDYHNWVMFEADGGWGVADPHANIFIEDQGNYVAFRLLKAQTGSTENSQRFFIHDPRVTVAMN
jgi:transglutaminase-like putative cysteine protease